MPIFEYECLECGEEFEILALTDLEKQTMVLPCIECEAPSKRVMSRAAFEVKGASSANGYSSTGREVTMDDFDDAHKFNPRTTEERKRGVESFE